MARRIVKFTDTAGKYKAFYQRGGVGGTGELKKSRTPNICQLDGNMSAEESDGDSVSNYSSDDEVDSEPVRAVLVPAPRMDGQQFNLTVDQTEEVAAPSSLPLTMVANFRSI